LLGGLLAAAMTCGLMPANMLDENTAEAASFDYPVQQFRMGIADTNRNVNISETESGSPVTSDKDNGTDSENWYLNYISAGVYEIVNAATDYVLTAESGYCTIAPDTDAANQRWNITAVQQDFEGFDLYYKITSNADASKALTFTPDTNSFSLDSYSGGTYQKYKLNLKGLEGFAANAKVAGGEKAGTIGGLLGETVFVDTTEECVAAMKRTEPLTIVVTENLEFNDWNKTDQKIESNKTILGSYSKNIIYNSQWRNDEFYGDSSIPPSNNIVFQNLHFRASELNSNGCGVILVYIYCGRNVWFDHNDFSASFGHNRDVEVGKFIWINTPSMGWADDCYNGISPDYVTISSNHFNNRSWTVAYGTQNTETTRDRTTLMFNKWENCARRTPQIGNGTGHVYNSYHTYSITEPSQQIIAGDGCTMLTEYCYFEGLKGLEFAGGGSASSPFRDTGSVSAASVGGSASAMNQSFQYSHSWNPGTENYGYSLISANDTKSFCNSYSGAVTKLSDMKYITDSDLSGMVMKKYESPFLKEIEVGELSTGKEGTVLSTENTYTFKNSGSGLYLAVADGTEAAGTDVIQAAENGNAASWTLKESGNADGYYYVISKLGDGRTYFLDVASMGTDNGTNIGIWTDTACDAQLFKFVDNGDGTFQIATKVTKDASGIGIVAGSTESGASAVQWKYDGSANQKWIIEIDSTIAQNLQIKDTAHIAGWAAVESVKVGDPVFGDRDATYTALPDALIGAEYIRTACDSKNSTEDLAVMTVTKDGTVYAAFDSRVTSAPAWLSGWTKNDMTAVNSKDVTFVIYALEVNAGDTVTLGTNGQSASCVNYTVFLTEKAEEETTTEATTTETTTSTEETTEETTAQTTASTEETTAESSETTATETVTPDTDEVVYGDVNVDGKVTIADILTLNKNLLCGESMSAQGTLNADVDGDGKPTSTDALNILKYLIMIIDTLPV
ncbi:MAG: RICIN domain-containing protein, partial [Oscillospiraceae bacterium]|nr:RICIN domain-containing protein [Oscillospiraceae bacterium]